MHAFSNLLVFGFLAVNGVYGAAIPDYIARHRARSVSMAGLKLVNGSVAPSSYIVKITDTANRGSHLAWANQLVRNSNVSDATTVRAFSKDFFNAYSAELDDDAVAKLLTSKDVAWVEEDAIMHTQAEQTDATWGLQRLSFTGSLPPTANPTDLNFTYISDDHAGAGVDVYVIDTGLRPTHQQFEGRAEMVFSLPGLNQTDDNGHGNHVSGTVGGVTFGVAKQVSIKGVKVMDKNGSGSSAGIISGIDFAVQGAKASGRPSVISMSIGGSGSSALDNAAAAAVTAGVHVVVAAGNAGQDASGSSPARANGVITVGSMNILDRESTFSNFGPDVTIFAPGETIISCGLDSDTAVATLSGTSMATPHISGLVALLLSENPSTTTTQMVALLQKLSVQGALSAVPAGTPNAVAQNAFGTSPQAST